VAGASDCSVFMRSTTLLSTHTNHDTWRAVTIRTDFAPGTKLHDYSGANSADLTVPDNQRVTIEVPPARGDGAVKRKGYSIWGPEGIAGSLNSPISTTQVWEMANDLGDSHTNSLGQGGGMAAGDRSAHFVGQIQTAPRSGAAVRVVPEYEAKRYRLTALDASGSVAFDSGAVAGTHTFNSPAQGVESRDSGFL
jgi:alpha-amylase